MSSLDNLFAPLSLGRGGVTLPNRIVMAPMTLNQATQSGHLTPWIVEWYRRRAAGGVGAIIGAAVVGAPHGRGGARRGAPRAGARRRGAYHRCCRVRRPERPRLAKCSRHRRRQLHGGVATMRG